VEFWRCFASAETPAHILTQEGRIVATNTAFDRMIGMPGAQIVGRHQAHVNNRSVAANLQLLREIGSRIAAQGCWTGVLENCRRDGTIFRTRAIVEPIDLGGRRLLVCLEQEQAGREPWEAGRGGALRLLREQDRQAEERR
jgi:PAS domain S-box-containing protein